MLVRDSSLIDEMLGMSHFALDLMGDENENREGTCNSKFTSDLIIDKDVNEDAEEHIFS